MRIEAQSRYLQKIIEEQQKIGSAQDQSKSPPVAACLSHGEPPQVQSTKVDGFLPCETPVALSQGTDTSRPAMHDKSHRSSMPLQNLNVKQEVPITLREQPQQAPCFSHRISKRPAFTSCSQSESPNQTPPKKICLGDERAQALSGQHCEARLVHLQSFVPPSTEVHQLSGSLNELTQNRSLLTTQCESSHMHPVNQLRLQKHMFHPQQPTGCSNQYPLPQQSPHPDPFSTFPSVALQVSQSPIESQLQIPPLSEESAFDCQLEGVDSQELLPTSPVGFFETWNHGIPFHN